MENGGNEQEYFDEEEYQEKEVAEKEQVKENEVENVQKVARHYDERPLVDFSESDIPQLRRFNNWVKMKLYEQYLKPNDSVVDVGCGRGQDLKKIATRGVRSYLGIDISSESLKEAQKRLDTCGDAKLKQRVAFRVLDFFHAKESGIERSSVDAVTFMFSMHYAFSSEQSVRQMLQHVSDCLKPGGVMMGCSLDASVIIKLARHSIQKNDENGKSTVEIGNNVYRIRMEKEHAVSCLRFGHKYDFWLKGSIDCHEYLIHWNQFDSLAQEYGLKCVLRKGFHSYFQDKVEDNRLNVLRELIRFSVLSTKPDGLRTFDQDQWEAVRPYCVFAYKRI